MRHFLWMVVVVAVTLVVGADPVWAGTAQTAAGNGWAAIGAGIAISLAATGGALGQGRATAAAVEGIARNPNARAGLFVPFVLGLVLIESLAIYAFVIALMLVGKV